MNQMQNILFAGVLAVLLVACGGTPEPQEDTAAVPAAASAPPADNPQNLSAASLFPYDWRTPADASAPAANPISQNVTTGSLVFETRNVRSAISDIETLARQYKGRVASSKLQTLSGRAQVFPQNNGTMLKVRRYTHQADMHLYIPYHAIEKFLGDVGKHIVFLDSRELQTQNLLLEIRRNALEADRQRQLTADFEDSNNRAASSPEPANTRPQNVFDDKARTDLAELQKEYWQYKVDYAELHFIFRQPEAILKQEVPNLDAAAAQHQPGFEAMLAPMLKQGWSGFLGVILFFIGIWPLALGIPLLWLGWKRWRQSESEEAQDTLPPPAESDPFDDEYDEEDDEDERF